MKYSLNITKSMVGMCIFLGTPLLTFAANAFVPTYGGWYNNGAFSVTLPQNTQVPFVFEEEASGITNTANTGSFVFSKAGIYQVNVGVQVSVRSQDVFLFELRLNGSAIPGGGLAAQVSDTTGESLVTLSTDPILFSANAGDTLTFVYLGAVGVPATPVVIGPTRPNGGAGFIVNPANSAFITINQLK